MCWLNWILQFLSEQELAGGIQGEDGALEIPCKNIKNTTKH